MDALAIQLVSDKGMPLISNEILHLPVLYIVKLLSARVGFIADDIVDFFVDFQQNVLRNSTVCLFQLQSAWAYVKTSADSVMKKFVTLICAEMTGLW